jgi:hypothetical protein
MPCFFRIHLIELSSQSVCEFSFLMSKEVSTDSSLSEQRCTLTPLFYVEDYDGPKPKHARS